MSCVSVKASRRKDISYVLGKQWLFEVEQQRNLSSGVGRWVGRVGFIILRAKPTTSKTFQIKQNYYKIDKEGGKKKLK